MAALTQTRWQRGWVRETEDVADGVRRIVLEPEHPAHAAPGTHVDIALAGRRTRSYSVVRSEDGGRRLTLSVQLSPTSRGGSRAMHALAVGDEVTITGPVQSFPLAVGAPRYVLVAGGIGLTALVAMASALRRRDADYELVVVGRRREVLPYLDALRDEHGDRLRLHVDDEGTSLDVDALVGGIAADGSAAGTELYMCGPIRLMDAIRRSWAAHDLPVPNLRFETFGSSGSWASEEFVVKIPQFDREVVVDSETSILDALEDAGLDVLSDCRKGECGLCLVNVLDVDGAIDHRDVFFSQAQRERGSQLCICVSRAARPEPATAGHRAELTVRLP